MSNDFIIFGGSVGANVDSQANFLTRSNNTGFVAGAVAESSWVGKLFRQTSIIARVITQFIVDRTGQSVVDDGTATTIEAQFLTALQTLIPASGVLTFNGRNGNVTLTSGDVTTALGATPIFVGGTAAGDLTGSWPGPSIKSSAVTNAKLANMGALTIKGNNTGAPAAPTDIAISDLLTALGFDFSNAAGTNGYFLAPNGYKRCWGQAFIGDDAAGNVVLPFALNGSINGHVSLIYSGSVKSGGNGGGATWNQVSGNTVRIMVAWNGDSTGIGLVSYEFWGT